MEGNPIVRGRGRPRKAIGQTVKKDLDLSGLFILYRHDLSWDILVSFDLSSVPI